LDAVRKKKALPAQAQNINILCPLLLFCVTMSASDNNTPPRQTAIDDAHPTPSVDTSIQLTSRAQTREELAKRAQNLLEQSRKLNENLAKQLSRNEPSSSTSVPVRTPDTQEPVTSVDIGSAPVSNQKQSVCCARLSLLQVAGLTVSMLIGATIFVMLYCLAPETVCTL